MRLTAYTIPSKISCTIALVADLHEHEPRDVLELLHRAEPDIICVAGDTFERCECGEDPHGKPGRRQLTRKLHSAVRYLDGLIGGAQKGKTDPANGYRLLREAAQIAPVFLSLGNHEWYLTDADRTFLAANNITLLDNTDCDWHGIHIGGLSSIADLAWLDVFEKQDGYKILLCHHPEFYPRYLQDKNIDLILAGHAHGGQIKLFGRGIFSPGQGLFPKYHHGVYDGRMVVSSGCANTAAVPRWGNPCEVVVVSAKKDGIHACFKNMK